MLNVSFENGIYDKCEWIQRELYLGKILSRKNSLGKFAVEICDENSYTKFVVEIVWGNLLWMLEKCFSWVKKILFWSIVNRILIWVAKYNFFSSESYEQPKKLPKIVFGIWKANDMQHKKIYIYFIRVYSLKYFHKCFNVDCILSVHQPVEKNAIRKIGKSIKRHEI